MSKPARKFFGTYKFRKKQNWNLNFQASVFPNLHSTNLEIEFPSIQVLHIYNTLSTNLARNSAATNG